MNNDKVLIDKEIDKDNYIKFKINQFVEFKKTNQYKTEIKEYYENWRIDKKIVLSRKNTRDLTKKEIIDLKKDYQNPPKIEMIENFIFLTKNIDFVIIDY